MMATAQELLDKVAAFRASLVAIRGDIQTIKDGLPPTGGLTAEEVETLRVALDDAVTDAAGLDAENPAP